MQQIVPTSQGNINIHYVYNQNVYNQALKYLTISSLNRSLEKEQYSER